MQQLLRPVSPGGVFTWSVEGRARAVQQIQVIAIALGFVALPVQYQALKGVIVFALEAEAEQVAVATRGKQFARLFGILLVDPARQLADAATFAEASRVAQHDHLLGERMTALEVFLQAAGAEVFAADRLQPLARVGAVPAGFGITA
ncbi:hypothetical protein [Pseudomonas sp. 22 E 5]|nr:hypothetical protein [Pseudomonas sp. 22 E 5]